MRNHIIIISGNNLYDLEGFGISEYEEPIKLLNLGDELIQVLLKIMDKQDHIEFETIQ